MVPDDEVTVESVRDADILPDEIVDKHLDADPDDLDPDNLPDPDLDEESSPDDDADDDLDDADEGTEDDDDERDEEDPDDDDDGADDDPDDDDDDDDDADDDDEKDSDDDEDEDEEDDVLETVTTKDHRRIQKDPSLKKVYAHMQKAFTAKTMELKTLQSEVERRDGRITAFQEAIRSGEGMARFISATLESNPDIIGMAFHELTTSENANPEAFLVEVGLESPDILEAAWERVQELQGDEGELKAHNRDRKRASREAALDAREKRGREDAFDVDMTRVEGTAQKEAARLKIHPDDMEEVNDRIKAGVREHLDKGTGKIGMTNADVKAVVAEAKKTVDKALSRARRRLEEEGVRTSRKGTKKRAAGGRRPKRDKKGGPPKKKVRKKTFKAPDIGDGLDAFVDHRMAQLGS